MTLTTKTCVSFYSSPDLKTLTRWLDYGPDEYAGITWSNTGTRNICRLDEQLAVF